MSSLDPLLELRLRAAMEEQEVRTLLRDDFGKTREEQAAFAMRVLPKYTGCLKTMAEMFEQMPADCTDRPSMQRAALCFVLEADDVWRRLSALADIGIESAELEKKE